MHYLRLFAVINPVTSWKMDFLPQLVELIARRKYRLAVKLLTITCRVARRFAWAQKVMGQINGGEFH